MEFVSLNPYSQKLNAEFASLSDKELQEQVKKAVKAQKKWSKTPLEERCRLVLALADELERNKSAYAISISSEMGKPIREARAEIGKCALLCRYYAENAMKFLADVPVPTHAKESFIRYEPLGVILGIMPWNFPFWQVFRFAVPTLLSGNSVLIKHAPNVPQSALDILEVFSRSRFPDDLYQNLFISVGQTEKLIANKNIQGISLTGSERAGRSVAAVAGKALKKCLLELGGSNALIVFEDADINKAMDLAVSARFNNTGQSCIAAKRMLIPESWKDKWVSGLKERIEALSAGDPLKKSTQIGPLARIDLAKNLDRQVKESIEMGAVLQIGGKRKKAFYEPTLLSDVQPGMPAFDEETFGPLAVLTTYSNEKEAIKLANKTRFGLGVCLVTKDTEKAKNWISAFPDGSVFINQWVKSDPRLPFGGQKASGYGRELAQEGILAFVNVKTVLVEEGLK